MTEWQKKVKAFHKKYDHPIGGKFGPHMMEWHRLRDRLCWMQEELDELMYANGLTGQVDALVDLIYFALGTAVEMGVDLERVFNIVHRANMRKAGGKRDADGKVQKQIDWVGPEDAIARELSRQENLVCKS